MDSIDRPLARLHEIVDHFVVVPEIELLHVVTSASLRIDALERIAAFEHHPANRSPWFFLEAPVEAKDGGWSTRIDELVLQWNFHATDDARPRFEAIARSSTENTMVAFTAEVARIAGRVPAPLAKPVIVLAPIAVAHRDRWIDEAGSLLALRAGLAEARFVVVDLEEPLVAVPPGTLGKKALVVDARVDLDALRAEQWARLEGMKKHAGVADFRSRGLAGPSVEPPPRHGRAAPSNEAIRAALASAGLLESLAPDGEVPASRRLSFEASLHFAEGRIADAVRIQSEARDLLDRAGFPHDAGLLEILIASYAMAGSAWAEAERALHRAGERASGLGDPALGLEARLALGGLFSILQRHGDAARVYADAAPLASLAGEPALEVEAWRLAGQALVAAELPDDAAKAFSQAIRVATEAPPERARKTSAPEAARELAGIYDRHGLTDHAASLRQQADRIAGGST
jgi:tetratricopeptide (TPR) repeat protein